MKFYGEDYGYDELDFLEGRCMSNDGSEEEDLVEEPKKIYMTIEETRTKTFEIDPQNEADVVKWYKEGRFVMDGKCSVEKRYMIEHEDGSVSNWRFM